MAKEIGSPKVHEPEFVWPGKEPDNEDWDDPATHHRGGRRAGLIVVIAFVGAALIAAAPFLWG